MHLGELFILAIVVALLCTSFFVARAITKRKKGRVLLFVSIIIVVITLLVTPRGTRHIDQLLITAVILSPLILGGLIGGLVGWYQAPKFQPASPVSDAPD